ncbi:MAG TPA: hypothetical protein VJZ27_07100, partial [Aggregatilineales bacterium]|nr:hypothetical protein [Aggregatilineales bacterium]
KRNPVRSDGRDSRPAGAIFAHNGALYRPAQNSTRRRQEKLVLHRILQLDTESYREEKITEIDPRWLPNMVAVHTLNHAGGISIIDAKVRVFRPLYRRWRRKHMHGRT